MILDKKIQGIVITSCCRVEERKIIVACIYFAWMCDVMKKKKYRLPCMLLSERKVGDWLSIFCVRMARKKRQARIRWKDTRYKRWKEESGK